MPAISIPVKVWFGKATLIFSGWLTKFSLVVFTLELILVGKLYAGALDA
jgi:hypothetical protein